MRQIWTRETAARTRQSSSAVDLTDLDERQQLVATRQLDVLAADALTRLRQQQREERGEARAARADLLRLGERHFERSAGECVLQFFLSFFHSFGLLCAKLLQLESRSSISSPETLYRLTVFQDKL